MLEKTCIYCEVKKTIDEFYKRKGSADGYRNDCKECCSNRSRHRHLKNRDERLKKQKAYHQKRIQQNPNFYADLYRSKVDKMRILSAEYYKKKQRGKESQRKKVGRNKSREVQRH